jgi:alpha-galactosidase
VTEVRLDAGPQTIALAYGPGLPEVIYWGPRLPLAEDLTDLAAASRSDLTGGMLDALPALSLCPEAGRAWQGQPGLVLSEADGTPISPRFSFDRLDQSENSLALRSSGAGLILMHRIEAMGDTFVLTTALNSDRPIRVQWLSAPVLPGPQLADDIIDVAGKWTREFALQHTPWSIGIRLREARTGRSGHEHPPMAIFPERGATNTDGRAYGLQYGWSGGHRMVAEELPDGRRHIQFGHATGSETEAGTTFETAPLYAAFSDSGLNGIAVTWQHLCRDRIVQWPEPARPRPVHYNSWEGVYFDHDLSALKSIADKAALLGAERFVLDDGWFGQRDDDTTSLGDWVIDRQKWPDGLHPLIAHVHALKMTFGLWFEPEMVNPDSDLFRAHPDWALGPSDQILGRNQMVLNLALPEVGEMLFDRISAILTEYPIDYIKWDHNRLLPVLDAGQTRGAYALLDRLRRAHPGAEIESCASGGGRIDAGILARTHRVWLSDCNDALERLRMQHDAALFIPSCITGSHVGPRHSHTTGRILPMAFRAWVAAQRHMGFEMDLRELTEDEAATLTSVTAWYKANRAWMTGGDILRLDSADPSVTAEVQIAADRHRFVVFAGQTATSEQVLPRPLRLTGLDPDDRYKLRLINSEDAPKQSRGPNALKSGPLTLTGRSLMSKGLLLPVAWPATMWVIEGQKL